MKRSPLHSPYLFPLLVAAIGCGETMMDPPEDGADLGIIVLDSRVTDDGGTPDGGVTEDGAAESGLPGSGASLQIARDERGVPHITAATLEDAMFGLGFVQAEDRLFQASDSPSSHAGSARRVFRRPAYGGKRQRRQRAPHHR